MIGRGIAVLAVMGGAAMLVEGRFGGFRVEIADPAMLGVALFVLFIIVVATLPARPGDYSGVSIRSGGWTLAAALALVAYSHLITTRDVAYRDPTPTIAVASAPGEVELERAFDGHFRARAQIGDAEIGMMLDTGASIVLLRHDDAARVGFDMDQLIFATPVTTANGRAMVAPVTLDAIRIGGVIVQNVRAAVAQSGNLHTSLLGMSFLGELDEVSIRRDRMFLRN